VKIYVAAALEALSKKTERGDETEFTTKIGGKTTPGKHGNMFATRSRHNTFSEGEFFS
jgi:hypothetical protein